MSETKRLDRFYDRLDPQERFRLAIKARGRGDEREFRRLVDSSPRQVYRCTDLEFGDRCEASETISDAAMAALLPINAKLELLAAFRALFDLAMHEAAERAAIAYVAGRRTSKHRIADGEFETGIEKAQARLHDLHDRFEETFSDIESALQGEAAAILEAFSAVCREDMGLEPEEVLSAHWSPFADLTFGGAPPNRETTRELGDRMSRTWAGVMSSQPFRP